MLKNVFGCALFCVAATLGSLAVDTTVEPSNATSLVGQLLSLGRGCTKIPCAMARCAGGNCSKYNACSVDRNLFLADGNELARYRKEVASDGERFTNWIAPEFDLPTTHDRQVSLGDYRGQHVVLVLLSGHCSHSLETLPIIAELKRRHANDDLDILPVFVNSGSVEDLAARAWEMDLPYPLIVSEDQAISRAYDSRMIPSTFLIDRNGRVTRKLVGFKKLEEMDAAIEELIRSQDRRSS